MPELAPLGMQQMIAKLASSMLGKSLAQTPPGAQVSPTIIDDHIAIATALYNRCRKLTVADVGLAPFELRADPKDRLCP